MSKNVNFGTKQADVLIHDFFNSYYKGKTLYDVYKSPSVDKIKTWEVIRLTCYHELEGFNLHITGASSYHYSCIYAFWSDADTVVIRKETHANTYDLAISRKVYKELFAKYH